MKTCSVNFMVYSCLEILCPQTAAPRLNVNPYGITCWFLAQITCSLFALWSVSFRFYNSQDSAPQHLWRKQQEKTAAWSNINVIQCCLAGKYCSTG